MKLLFTEGVIIFVKNLWCRLKADLNAARDNAAAYNGKDEER
jgi:hypothetical protein